MAKVSPARLESLPAPTAARATVGGGAALQERRGRAWIGFPGARGGVARWLLLKMAPSLPTARASGRARRGSAGVAVRVGLTGPNRTRRQVDSAWSSTLPSRALRARTESPSPCPEPSLGPTGQAGGISAHRFCLGLRTLSRFLSAGLDGWDARHHRGLAMGFLQGRLQWVLGRLSCRCYVGWFGPRHFVSWQRHRTKSPEPWGVPQVDAWVYFLSGPTGSLPSWRIPKPALSPVAPAAWDSQS